MGSMQALRTQGLLMLISDRTSLRRGLFSDQSAPAFYDAAKSFTTNDFGINGIQH